MNYRFNDPKTNQEGKAPYEDIVASVQNGLLSKDVIVTGPHGSTTPFAITEENSLPVIPQVEPDPTEELLLHQDPSVTVTTARAVFGGNTYPIRNITSVRVAIVPPKYGLAVILMLAGAALLGAMFFLPGQRVPLCVFGTLCLLLAALAAKAAKALYRLTVGNAGTEFIGTSSHSKDYVSRLHQALNEAIVRYR